MITQVLLPLPTDQTFDFLVPEELENVIAVGKRARVRFQEKARWGIVAGLAAESEHPGPLEKVLEINPAPAFSQEALTFCTRIAEYYLAPLGPVANRMLPRRVSRESERFVTLAKGLDEILAHLETLPRRAPRQAAVLRLLLATSGPCSEAGLRKQLGSVRAVLDRLSTQGWIKEVKPPRLALRKARFPRPAWVSHLADQQRGQGQVFLFTRNRWNAYLCLIETTLADSKNALILAPEILLAAQLRADLREQLGSAVDLYHSGLPESERGDVWEKARMGKSHLVVGTRSALFLPLTKLGLLILDEEQDWTYKQDEMLPYYHARTVAEERISEGLLVLGSFAPSLETFHATERGDLVLIRPQEPKPKHTTNVVDMRGEKDVLSQSLVEAIDRTLALGKQVLLGVNRRGYFKGVLCKTCGHLLRCPDCGVNLTYHVQRAQLVCHLCGKAYGPMRCSHCGLRALRFVGVGSERVEHAVRERFPNARVLRIDTDTLRGHLQQGVVEEGLTEKADILVATQMLAKGPALPRLGLVGAVSIDTLLALPNFRAAERTYQYLTGLIGRLVEGEAIIQTHYPDHYAVRAAASEDYDRFYAQEIAERKALFYPPFSHLARLLLTGRSVAKRRKDFEQLETILHRFEVEIRGPIPHPSHRRCETLLVKGADPKVVRAACAASQKAVSNVEIDIDPYWI